MSLSEKAKTTCFIHNEMYYKNASPDEKWVRLSDHQQEIDCLKDCLRKSGSTTLLLSKDLQKCERERDLQKQKLQLHLAKYPKDHFIRDTNGKETGAVFIPKEKDFEKWLKELEELLK